MDFPARPTQVAVAVDAEEKPQVEPQLLAAQAAPASSSLSTPYPYSLS
jgi:hypothetical protein